jgi:hypothetical protein
LKIVSENKAPNKDEFMQDKKVKQKRKRTAAEKAAKKRRQLEYMYVFMNGKQVRVKRPPTIDGMDPDEFILQNADPIWLHQNEMWEYIDVPSDNLLFAGRKP